MANCSSSSARRSSGRAEPRTFETANRVALRADSFQIRPSGTNRLVSGDDLAAGGEPRRGRCRRRRPRRRDRLASTAARPPRRPVGGRCVVGQRGAGDLVGPVGAVGEAGEGGLDVARGRGRSGRDRSAPASVGASIGGDGCSPALVGRTRIASRRHATAGRCRPNRVAPMAAARRSRTPLARLPAGDGDARAVGGHPRRLRRLPARAGDVARPAALRQLRATTACRTAGTSTSTCSAASSSSTRSGSRSSSPCSPCRSALVARRRRSPCSPTSTCAASASSAPSSPRRSPPRSPWPA